MNRAFLAALLGVLLLFTGACKQKDNKDEIRAGVVKHLASMNGLNVNNMDIVVTKATVNGNQAQADVTIRAKGTDPNSPGMQLTYAMEKRGDDWVVVKGQATGGMQHPSPGEAPQGGALPPGHPATGGTAGHSDFSDIMNSSQPPAQAPPAQQPTQKPSTSGKP